MEKFELSERRVLSGLKLTSVNSPFPAQDKRWGRTIDGTYDLVGDAIWSLWIPQNHGVVAKRRISGKLQTRVMSLA